MFSSDTNKAQSNLPKPPTAPGRATSKSAAPVRPENSSLDPAAAAGKGYGAGKQQYQRARHLSATADGAAVFVS